MVTVTASAPGKTILFGEHSVVHGRLAIATALSDLRISTTVAIPSFSPSSSKNLVTIDLIDLNINISLPTSAITSSSTLCHLQTAPNRAPRTPPDSAITSLTTLLTSHACPPSHPNHGPLLPLLYLLTSLLSPSSYPHGVTLTVNSRNLPTSAGLGSSAAACVATAAALLTVADLLTHSLHGEGISTTPTRPTQESLSHINAWAYAAESIIHGTPSGIDNTVSTYGGCVTLCKERGQARVEMVGGLPVLNLLLTNTHVPKSTKKLVGMVGGELRAVLCEARVHSRASHKRHSARRRGSL